MKKFTIIIMLLLSVVSVALHAQTKQPDDLIKSIVGKWKVVKYQSQKGTQVKPDILVFNSDGTFLSDSIYFATRSGLFRTDENRNVLILENGTRTTEWAVTLRKGVLRMRSLPGSKQPLKVTITALAVKEG